MFDIPLTYGDMVRDPSPEGPGSLIKYVDNPVDYSTGALSVSVPLYSWSESGRTFALSLDYHTYHTDYQGNILAVTSATGAVEQRTFYYPDGLPMTLSTAPEVNAFKYTGKELDTYLGIPSYDYHARLTTPSLFNTFRSIDPCAGISPGISPYAFCGGDPINRTDPTGMEWDKVSKKTVEQIRSNIQTQVNNLEEDIKKNKTNSDPSSTKDKKSEDEVRLDCLKKALDDIDRMTDDKVNTFSLCQIESGDKCGVGKKNNGKIVIYASSDATYGHEFRHIGQYYDDRKEFQFDGNGKLTQPTTNFVIQSIYEEDAYKVQFSINKNDMPDQLKVNRISDVTIDKIGNMTDQKTKKIYIQT